MFRIFGLHTPTFIKAVLAAEELQVPYEVVPVDLLKGEHTQPEHILRHPFAKIPVLEHNGKYMFESNSIVRYLGSQSASPMYPKDAWSVALVDQWIDYFGHQVGEWTATIWFQTCIAPKYFGTKPDLALLRDREERLLAAMPVVDAHLKSSEWLTGSQVTVADTVAYVLMSGFREANLNFGDFKSFVRWFAAYESRPAPKKIMRQYN